MKSPIDSLLDDALRGHPSGRPRILWVRTEDAALIPLKAPNAEGEKGLLILHATIPPGPPRGPLEPILPLLCARYAILPREERMRLLREARFPASQRLVFERWAMEGRAVDPDLVPFADGAVRYARNAWFTSLARLFVLLSQSRPRLLAVHEAQRASQALIRFLEALASVSSDDPVTIVLLARGDREWTGPADLDRLSSFLSRLDDLGCFLGGKIEISTSSPPARPVDSPNASPSLKAVEAQFILHCHEDALAALESGHTGTNIAAHELLRGECWALLGDASRASLHLDETIEELREPEELLRAQLLFCRTSGWKRQKDRSRRALDAAWKLAASIGGPLPEIQCLLHEIFFRDIFGTDPDLISLVDRILDASGPLRLRNIGGYAEGVVSVYLRQEEAMGWDGAVALATAAMARARKDGDRYRQSVLCHVLGVLHERKGREGKALEYFTEGIRLRRRLGDPVELIKLYNGTGYYCFTIGKFKEALDYFSKSLRILGQLSDFQEACLTLCNMAQAHFYSGRFRAALALMEAVLEVMDILDYPGLPFHRRSKLQAIAAACAWHLGRSSRAIELARAIRQDDIDHDARPYVTLVTILLECDAAPEEEAIRRFDEGIASAETARLDFLKIHFTATKGIFLQRRDSTLSRRFIVEAWGLTTARRLDYQTAWLRDVMEGQAHEEAYGEALPSDLRTLIQGLSSSARQEAAGKRLLSALNQIQFLQGFQSGINPGMGRSEVLGKAVSLIEEHLQPMRARIRGQASPPAAAGDTAFTPSDSLEWAGFILELDGGNDARRSIDAEQYRVLHLALAHLALVLDLQQARQKRA